MTEAALAAWVHVFIESIGMVGGILGLIGGLGLLLAKKTFATHDEIDRRFSEHATLHTGIDQRLAAGENQFTRLSGAIDAVKIAADQAKGAGEDACAAAERLAGVYVDIAGLRGEMKSLEASLRPIERLTMDMVEGHMAAGRHRGA